MDRGSFNRLANLIILLLLIVAIFIAYSLIHQDKEDISIKEEGSALPQKRNEENKENHIVIPPSELPLRQPGKRDIVIKDGLNLDPKIREYNDEGLRLYNQGRYEEAADLLRKAYDKDKENGTMRMNLAHIEGRLGWKEIEAERYEDALRHFRDALELFNRESEFHIGMGFAFHRLREDDRAIDSLTSGLAIDPKRKEGYRLLAEIYYQRNDMDMAINNLEASLKIDPDDNNIKGMLSKITREKKVEGGFQQEATDHFIVRFEGREERETARITITILEEAYREIGASLSFYPGKAITVILYPEEQFRDVTRTPAWTKGIFDGKIRLPIRGALGDQRLLEKVLFHEYTHAVIHNLSGKDVPTWLNEGLAIYMEHGEKGWLEDILSNELKKGGKIIPLHELHETFMNMEESRVSLVYAESYSAVDYLIDRYGIFRVKTLLQELPRRRDFREVFKDLFFISYDEFQSSWEKSIMNRT